MNIKVNESLKAYRLFNLNQTLDVISQKLHLSRTTYHQLEQSKLTITPYYQELLLDKINFIVIDSKQEKAFYNWVKELLELWISRKSSRNLFNQCPISLDLIQHSHLYIDYLLIDLLLHWKNYDEHYYKKIGQCIYEEDGGTYDLFYLVFAYALSQQLEYKEAYLLFTNVDRERLIHLYPSLEGMYSIFGSLCTRKINVELSYELLNCAIDFFSSHGYQENLYFCKQALGSIKLNQKEYLQANQEYLEVLDYYLKNNKNEWNISALRNNACWSYLLLGEYDLAYQICLDFNYYNIEAFKSSFYFYLAICYYKQHNFFGASLYAKKCLALKEDYSYSKRYCKFILRAIKYREKQRLFDQMEKFYNKLLAERYDTDAWFIAKVLSEGYEQLGDSRQAKLWYQRYAKNTE